MRLSGREAGPVYSIDKGTPPALPFQPKSFTFFRKFQAQVRCREPGESVPLSSLGRDGNQGWPTP